MSELLTSPQVSPLPALGVGTTSPLVSIVIPCRNESRSIGPCLDSIIANDYARDRLEVLVVDGMSDDGTRAVVQAYAAHYPFIHLLDNTARITPAALNVGIQHARGDIVMRMDAHTLFPLDYISTLVTAMEKSGADNVGGICITEPARRTRMGKAIALGLAHPLGVGNSYFRIGVAEPRQVDTVPFGCYRKGVFARIGGFDERLERNQDIEFNTRLKRAGGQILLIPGTRSVYHCPATLKGLAKQNFQNGRWNIYTRVIHPGVLSSRHFIPLAFVSSLLLFGALGIVFLPARLVWLGICAAYLGALLVGALSIARRHGWTFFLLMPLVFAVLHVSYGLGSLWGLMTVGQWKKQAHG